MAQAQLEVPLRLEIRRVFLEHAAVLVVGLVKGLGGGLLGLVGLLDGLELLLHELAAGFLGSPLLVGRGELLGQGLHALAGLVRSLQPGLGPLVQGVGQVEKRLAPQLRVAGAAGGQKRVAGLFELAHGEVGQPEVVVQPGAPAEPFFGSLVGLESFFGLALL